MYTLTIDTTVKSKPYNAIRELARIIDQTQGEFVALIGASKDAVASWEIGRNKLSESLTRRIAIATGAKEEQLLGGEGPLTTCVPGASAANGGDVCRAPEELLGTRSVIRDP